MYIVAILDSDYTYIPIHEIPGLEDITPTTTFILKPAVKRLLNDQILPYLTPEITENLDKLILSTKGITNLGILRYILIEYMNINGTVSEDLFLELYVDEFILSDVINLDLTETKKYDKRVDLEGQFILSHIQNTNPLDRNRYTHLYLI